MTITFSISATDFVEYYLFTSSKSAVINRKRAIAKYFFSLACIMVGVFLYLYDSLGLALFFAAIGIFWFILYPIMNKKTTKRFYARYISENYKNRIARKTEITIEKNLISVLDGKSDSKIAPSEFDTLIETANLFFLKLKLGTAFIIPKNQVDSEQFKAEIQKTGIPVLDETSWKWD